MSYQLPEKLKNLTPYQPVSAHTSIRLDANESFLSLPDYIRKDIGEQIAKIDFNRYPDPYAVELCKKFADFFQLPSELIVAGNGSDELLFLLMNCFSNAGDKLMTISPDFSMYKVYAELTGMQVEEFKKNENFLINIDELIATVKKNDIRILIFSNPCNPVSLAFSKEDVLRIVQNLEDVLIVVDEAYMEFAEESVLHEIENYSNMIVLKTLSKAFGLAAARLGFAVSNKTIIKVLKAAKSPYNVNTLSQTVGCILFNYPDYLKDCINEIKKSRNNLFNKLCNIAQKQPKIKSVQNTHSNFVFIEVEDAFEIYKALQQHGIAIRLIDNYLRISTGSEKENNILVRILSNILTNQNW